MSMESREHQSEEICKEQEREGIPLFVEIGGGFMCVPLIGSKRFDTERYVGFDIMLDKADNTILANSVREIYEHQGRSQEVKNISFQHGDARCLPLAPERVDELYFGNVFLSNFFRPDEVLRECYRILKKNGNLVINQSQWGCMDEKTLSDAFRGSGFIIERIINRTDSEWWHYIEPYLNYESFTAEIGKYVESLDDSAGYLVFAKKVNEQ